MSKPGDLDRISGSERSWRAHAQWAGWDNVSAEHTPKFVDDSRASLSIAWHTARDQIIQAAGVTAGPLIDLAGTIGAHVLDNLLPARRLRVSPRIVKRAISKYQARGPGIDRTSYKAIIGIDILAPPQTLTPTTNT